MSKRSYVKDNVIYDYGLPKSLQEISDIINNLEDIATKWQYKSEEGEKKIADLQHRLEVAEKALGNLYGKFEIVAVEYAKMETIPSKLHFKEQAENELKGEKDD